MFLSLNYLTVTKPTVNGMEVLGMKNELWDIPETALIEFRIIKTIVIIMIFINFNGHVSCLCPDTCICQDSDHVSVSCINASLQVNENSKHFFNVLMTHPELIELQEGINWFVNKINGNL